MGLLGMEITLTQSLNHLYRQQHGGRGGRGAQQGARGAGLTSKFQHGKFRSAGSSMAAAAVERHTKASAELAALLAGKDVALMGRAADLAALQSQLAALRRELEAARAALAAVAPCEASCKILEKS